MGREDKNLRILRALYIKRSKDYSPKGSMFRRKIN
jgi:hypothetical protein